MDAVGGRWLVDDGGMMGGKGNPWWYARSPVNGAKERWGNGQRITTQLCSP